jgi:hypothetical protein
MYNAKKKDFWQLKELEKMAPKLKGIVAQSVKEVLESLVVRVSPVFFEKYSLFTYVSAT